MDNRAVYSNDDKSQIFGGPTNAYVFTNSDKGRIWNASVKAQKTWSNGIYAMAAYSFLNAKEVNSIDAEITGDAFAGNAIVGDANKDVLAFSRYGDTHQVYWGFLKRILLMGLLFRHSLNMQKVDVIIIFMEEISTMMDLVIK